MGLKRKRKGLMGEFGIVTALISLSLTIGAILLLKNVCALVGIYKERYSAFIGICCSGKSRIPV